MTFSERDGWMQTRHFSREDGDVVCHDRSFKKVYPTDQPEPEFPDQLNHSLAATAEKPFLTTP